MEKAVESNIKLLLERTSKTSKIISNCLWNTTAPLYNFQAVYKLYQEKNPNSITLKVCIQQPWSLLSSIRAGRTHTCVSIVHIYYHNYYEVKSRKTAKTITCAKADHLQIQNRIWQKCIPKLQSKILSNLLLQLHNAKQQKCIKCM